MRLLLAGGGTGGHLFPAVALAQLLLSQDDAAAVQFVGTQQGLEARMLPKLGLPLKTVAMGGLVGCGWRGRLLLLPRLVKSLFQAKAIIDGFKPDVIVGVGGYSSVPVLLMAKWMWIPYLIHEQNALPGLSNKLLGTWAKKVCLSFPNTAAGFMQEKIVLTGNPLRPGMEEVAGQLPQTGKLLIFGGSRGARAINQAVMQMLPLLKDWAECPEILHQTGEEDFNQVQQAYRDAGLDPQQVVAFIDDMASAYAQSKLVVCRAGATTLAELTVCGRPAVLIPFPYAAADHQTVNARALADNGAALLLPQTELDAQRLAAMLRELCSDQGKLQQMADQGRLLAQPGAAEKILDQCRKIRVERK